MIIALSIIEYYTQGGEYYTKGGEYYTRPSVSWNIV